jgi:hypothetical protein
VPARLFCPPVFKGDEAQHAGGGVFTRNATGHLAKKFKNIVKL